MGGLRRFVPFLSGTVLLLGGTAHAAGNAEAVAQDFARRLQAAMDGTALEWDRLWAPGARDSTRRLLDLRTAKMFEWSELTVTLESAREGGRHVEEESAGAPALPEWVDAVVRVQGTATWNPRAYGVASAFWVLQLDEGRESNPVVRREAWRLVPVGGRWLARERVPLGVLEVVSLDVSAGVYPAQDALLVNCSYYLRSLADGVEICRFLLDRRAVVYGLVADGERAEFVRGGELGAMGLEGFSSESESSFRFPRPLAKGEEVLVKIRTCAPLVHMRGESFVTTLPIHAGPFRERVWYPVPLPDFLPGTLRGDFLRSGSLELRYPQGALTAVSPPSDGTEESVEDADAELMEEEVLRYRAATHFRDYDFFLVEPGVDLERLDWSAFEFSPFRLFGGLPFLPSLGGTEEREAPPPSGLDPHPRSRRAIVEPLLWASTYSSRDLVSELQDLMPLDLDELGEIFDDSAADADQGAGEPARE